MIVGVSVDASTSHTGACSGGDGLSSMDNEEGTAMTEFTELVGSTGSADSLVWVVSGIVVGEGLLDCSGQWHLSFDPFSMSPLNDAASMRLLTIGSFSSVVAAGCCDKSIEC